MKMMQSRIVCASGVLVWGSSPDFLVCIAKARALKHQWTAYLPHSTLRVQFYYPNKKRVPSADIRAALRALENASVADAVAMRLSAAVAIAPARSAARTAAIATERAFDFAVDVDSDFCQAGVVAPPDSPDLGNLGDLRIDGLVA